MAGRLQVTVLPKEEGRLYFTGLTYTLNKLQCTQLLLNQSSRLATILDLHQQAPGDLAEKSSTKKTSPSAPPAVRVGAAPGMASSEPKHSLFSVAGKPMFGGDKTGGKRSPDEGTSWSSGVEGAGDETSKLPNRTVSSPTENLLQVTEASVDLLK